MRYSVCMQKVNNGIEDIEELIKLAEESGRM